MGILGKGSVATSPYCSSIDKYCSEKKKQQNLEDRLLNYIVFINVKSRRHSYSDRRAERGVPIVCHDRTHLAVMSRARLRVYLTAPFSTAHLVAGVGPPNRLRPNSSDGHAQHLVTGRGPSLLRFTAGVR